MTADTRALDRFWQRLERLRVEDMVALAARPLDGSAHDVALERARGAAREWGLDAVIVAASADIDDWVVSMFNRSTVQPGWYEANWGRPGSATDRANLAQSLGEAATAILLGDRIDSADRDELVGPWAALLEAE
jgi:hypothetical protein